MMREAERIAIIFREIDCSVCVNISICFKFCGKGLVRRR